MAGESRKSMLFHAIMAFISACFRRPMNVVVAKIAVWIVLHVSERFLRNNLF